MGVLGFETHKTGFFGIQMHFWWAAGKQRGLNTF